MTTTAPRDEVALAADAAWRLRIPCENVYCRRQHVILRSGPIFATYHVTDEDRPQP